MTNWRLAKSLDQLRKQINAAAPNRNKVSDGTIGDAAHAKGKSEHNPDANGVVRAMDITHDPASGVDGTILSESLVASRDRRILYIIWNRRIINSEVQPWVWRPYREANPHDHHVHVSVKADPKLYDDTALWGFQLGAFSRPLSPQPSSPSRRPEPPQAIPDPEDALVEPDTRSGWEKFWASVAEFWGWEKKWPGR